MSQTSVQIDVVIPDTMSFARSFNRLRVFIQDGPEGDIEEITAEDEEKAALTGVVSGPWDLEDLDLHLVIDGIPYVVPFQAPFPVSLGRAIERVNAVCQSELASPAGGGVKLESVISGRESYIDVGGPASEVLGFIDETEARGKARRMHTCGDTATYTFVDTQGDTEWLYYTDLYNSETGASSEMSDPQAIDYEGLTLPDSVLTTCKIRLINKSGGYIQGQGVRFHVASVPYRIEIPDSLDEAFIMDHVPSVVYTNAYGYATIQLVRGATYDVVFEGTGFTRKIVAPDSSEFDVLNLLTEEDDRFDIVVPEINLLIRRS